MYVYILDWACILPQHQSIQNPTNPQPHPARKTKRTNVMYTLFFLKYSGTLCVDTFLFISGFLAMLLLLQKLDTEPRSAR